ncbi:MAG: IclR family transcriptional regulator C-terminal domain-containing protein [Oscillospiraceae bacterium]
MLSVYEGGSVITLDQVESREGLRIVSDIGSRLPVFCTSQGKVFLAHMSRAVLEREIPAIPVAMWMEGLKVTPRAMLSRAVAGIRGSSLLLNLPGSEKAARENLAAVIEALEHGLHMIAAEGHE